MIDALTRKIPMTIRKALSGSSVLDLYTLLCGAFLVLAPWLFGFVRTAGRLDTEIAGYALIALSAGGFIAFADWEEWLKVALGLWLLASPWVLGFVHTSAMHVSISIGVIVTFLSLLELWLAHDPDFAPEPRVTRSNWFTRSS